MNYSNMKFMEGIFNNLMILRIASQNLNRAIQNMIYPSFLEHLSFDEKHVVLHLAKSEGESMKELSDHFSIKPNVMTGIISKLKNRGMINRVEDTDRRKTIVSLTPEWQRLCDIYVREAEEVCQIAIEHIGDPVIDSLIRSIAGVIKKLDEKLPITEKTALIRSQS